MNKNEKILILGSGGLVGSAILKELDRQGFDNVLAPRRQELDLLNESKVLEYFSVHRPQHIFDAAAKVGGIVANNTYRGDFIFENLQIQNNLFKASLKYDVEKFLFLGSSCIYPKKCPQPIKEEYLLTSPLEATNEPYAIAKIAGLKTAENLRRQYGKNFFSVMPTNLYGVNDNFHPENSHVIPGLIQRFDESIKKGEKQLVAWGTGTPKREFLYVDDLANACLFLMQHQGELPYWINVGTGIDISIKELTHLIAELMNFKGDVVFDSSKPDGTPRKLLDVGQIQALGWKHKTDLKSGLQKTIEYYRNSAQVRSY